MVESDALLRGDGQLNGLGRGGCQRIKVLLLELPELVGQVGNGWAVPVKCG